MRTGGALSRLIDKILLGAKRMEVSARFLGRAMQNGTRELEMQFD